MEIWLAVWELLSIIVYVMLGTFIFIFILTLIARIVKFNKIKFKASPIIKSELVKKKMFKTTSGYELRWFGEIDPKSEFIIIGVHDIYRNRKDFDKLESWLRKNQKNKYSLVSYDQRNCGENEVNNHFSFGASISDLAEIIEVISETNPNAKIVLLGEGFGGSICSFFSKDKRVYKIISSSLRLNNPYKKGFNFYLKLWWGTLFRANTKLVEPINGLDFTDEKEYAKKLEDENITKNLLTVTDYYLWKKINKKSIKNINSSEISISIFLSNNDFYCDSKKIAKYLSKLDKDKYFLETIKEKKHYLLNTKKSEDVFELIVKNI
ncbi:serine aminopeptidase domain-containing protein [Spiroplasma endosymbiont of Cantharis nigra]|uniref:serine aminopeptidase domain-containing protein n=1 Tax=Spiroplasma endosymbiont of Cantharis nigra TaxID=3066278 RepID=UPI0030CC6FB5